MSTDPSPVVKTNQNISTNKNTFLLPSKTKYNTAFVCAESRQRINIYFRSIQLTKCSKCSK